MARDKLSQKDWAILKLLAQRSNISNEKIAEAIGSDTSTVTRHRQRLEKEGYIKGYYAILDHERLGLTTTTVALVQLRDHSTRSLTDFESALDNSFPNVIEFMRLQGRWDYALRMVTTNIPGDSQQFAPIQQALTDLPMVKLVYSSTVVGAVKNKPLPLFER